MKRRNFMKATLWTDSLRLDMEGRPAAVVRDLFISLPIDQQQALLDVLQAALQNRRQREAEKCHETHTAR